jgi:FtsH-binding integral membrane protein
VDDEWTGYRSPGGHRQVVPERKSVSTQITPYLIAIAVAFLPINAYALSNRQTLSKMLILSSVGLHVAVIASAVLLGCSAKYLGVVWSVFGKLTTT